MTFEVNDKSPPQWCPVRGIFDTGSPVNLVSPLVIDRCGFRHRVRRVDALELTGLGDQDRPTYTFQEKLSLDWAMHNSMKTHRDTIFYVSPGTTCDLLLGRDFIRENNSIEENNSFLYMGIPYSGSGTNNVHVMHEYEC